MFHILSFVVDTPERFEKLKLGHYNVEYKFIRVTSKATPDVLLQPQYFAFAPFDSMLFNTASGSYIRIDPYRKHSMVEARFEDGEHPLSGVPKRYEMYNINYISLSKPTTENIDSILQWTNAIHIRIFDYADVAVSLFKRAAELQKLTKLRQLSLRVHPDTYKEIQAATIIEQLPSLEFAAFGGIGLTGQQILDQYPAPNKWSGRVVGQSAVYERKEW